MCRRDVSFLNRGEPEIWRHFTSKSYFVKNRRYRLDHEDVALYFFRFDEVLYRQFLQSCGPKIEKTPAVVPWARKNPFLEDEVDALVGVVSNVPSSTLAGGLFDLLSLWGGSSSLSETVVESIPGGAPCGILVVLRQTWSKTETFSDKWAKSIPSDFFAEFHGWVKGFLFQCEPAGRPEWFAFLCALFCEWYFCVRLASCGNPICRAFVIPRMLACPGYLPSYLPDSCLFACGGVRRLYSM